MCQAVLETLRNLLGYCNFKSHRGDVLPGHLHVCYGRCIDRQSSCLLWEIHIAGPTSRLLIDLLLGHFHMDIYVYILTGQG